MCWFYQRVIRLGIVVELPCITELFKLSLSLCLCLCLSVCLSLFLSFSLSVCLSVCVSLSVFVCLSFCLSLSLPLSFCLSLCHSIFLSLPVSLPLSFPASICTKVYLSALVSLIYVAISLLLCRSLGLPFFSLSLSHSVSFPASQGILVISEQMPRNISQGQRFGACKLESIVSPAKSAGIYALNKSKTVVLSLGISCWGIPADLLESAKKSDIPVHLDCKNDK